MWESNFMKLSGHSVQKYCIKKLLTKTNTPCVMKAQSWKKRTFFYVSYWPWSILWTHFFFFKWSKYFNSNLSFKLNNRVGKKNRSLCQYNDLFRNWWLHNTVFLCKVHIFWEGHKILQNLHCSFHRYYIGQIYGGDFSKFCGLLRIYELYPSSITVHIKKMPHKNASLKHHQR